MKKLFKSYTELVQLKTFEERFSYLQLNGIAGEDVDAFRWLKQQYYRTTEWKRLRREILVRDLGMDLAFPGREIQGKIIIHHLNPITVDDLREYDPIISNPENLVCVSLLTHNAIHYGDSSILLKDPVERTAGDTCPWRR